MSIEVGVLKDVTEFEQLVMKQKTVIMMDIWAFTEDEQVKSVWLSGHLECSPGMAAM